LSEFLFFLPIIFIDIIINQFLDFYHDYNTLCQILDSLYFIILHYTFIILLHLIKHHQF